VIGERKMKILTINGSPRGAEGNTEQLVQRFLRGAKEAGAETQSIYLKDKTINHCTGCFGCWTRTPGVCIHKDDMVELLEEVQKADVIVFASPLYIFTVTGLMKIFMDRMIPLSTPFILKRGDHFTHPPRYEDKERKMVLISNAGFPETHHFNGLKETFRIYSGASDQMAGMICCSCGEILKVKETQESIQWYLDAVHKAGSEVVENGSISEETQEILDKPLLDPEIYSRIANSFWESQGVTYTPAEKAHSNDSADAILPPPKGRDTIKDIISGMSLTFRPEEAGNLEAVIQFNVTGDDPGQYYLDIAQQQCTAYSGVHPDPKLTINTPSEVWIKISNGKMNGATAMMTGKFTIDGDLGLLIQLNKLFSE